ncbi:MAG: peptidoglycan DD-metalloendopeptidase family protein [Paludibacteraceae bacterium]|nr:peptidoglycan DD-metalloendopeptidase family protein [Paludibacteraceae bacterium]
MKSIILKIKFVITAIMVSALLTACGGSDGSGESDENTEPLQVKEPTLEYGICTDSLTKVEGVVGNGESVSVLFDNLGIDAATAYKVQFLPDSLFNAKRVKAGNRYTVYFSNESDTLHNALENPKYFVYQNSLINYTVIELGDSLKAYRFIKPVEIKERVSEAKIESSLWNAITGNNLNISLANDLSDIYAWTIDFFGIQKGDGFKVYYTEQYVDGECIGIGEIKAACFHHNDSNYLAFKYDTLDFHGYWDANGRSLRKAFLKAPLNFKRISSTFTYTRKHPIYKTVRPHTGVDYAAPKGTPVWSIGDGKVVFKAYKGGGGNTIKIKHNSVYSTAYLHLSGYAKGLKVGDHVKQGQIIGYVGSTGASTGPHLDFRVWKNDKPINPLTMESPSVEPLPEKYMNGFRKVKDRYQLNEQ